MHDGDLARRSATAAASQRWLGLRAAGGLRLMAAQRHASTRAPA